ncbi:hypothetical protein E2C01_013690 [Portunus trituberculatus]|uniref:Uncharacterized protein n=1 Tax=Portunus trituberculatus TaxID=210409 RepID=A0A5B7DI04_PORTR|nr:hypothetical protein [Portunus trituberculatus]
MSPARHPSLPPPPTHRRRSSQFSRRTAVAAAAARPAAASRCLPPSPFVTCLVYVVKRPLYLALLPFCPHCSSAFR